MKRILVVDDDAAVRRTLEMHLLRQGYAVETARDGASGLEQGSSEAIDAVLLDLRLPKMEGFEVLAELKRRRPALPVVVITAYDDMQTAIEAIRLGALDHLGKPLDLEELGEVLDRALETAEFAGSGIALGEEPDVPPAANAIVGRSKAMKRVFKAIGAVADTPATVLLHGESGTGKELAARAIHFNSRARGRPFVAVSCSALAPTLLESELFGHEKGAFTGATQAKPGKFELAQGGTLFLDEVSEIPLDVQVKLLRFLQEKEFERVGGLQTLRSDARVIAATNRDLSAMMAEGTFRQDLYYRLRVMTIELPPLRDRPEDIPLLVRYFLEKTRREFGRSVEVVPQAAMDLLQDHPWPGNVRELENALRRAVLLSPGSVLLPEALQLERAAGTLQLPLLLTTLEDVERRHIENVLAFTGWDKTRAARVLDISRPTLNKRIREFGLRRGPS